MKFIEWDDPTPEGVAPIVSDFALTFWAPVVGPTSVLVMRAVGICLQGRRELTIDPADLGGLVGVRGSAGNDSTLRRTLRRLEQFRFLAPMPNGAADVYLARVTAPALSEGHMAKLPSGLRTVYRKWEEARVERQLHERDETLGAYCDDHGFEADDERCEANV